MADETKGKEGGSAVVIVISAVLALGAAGLVYYFHSGAAKAEQDLERSKTEYREMVDRMKKPVEEYLRKGKNRPDTVEAEDPLVFLDRKARQAQIPAGLFNISPSQPANVGTWKETTHTVTLRSTKDNPIKRDPIVDFLRHVETERKLTKSRNIQLGFAGQDFTSVVITFSTFQPK